MGLVIMSTTALIVASSATADSLATGLKIDHDDEGPAVNLAVWISLATMGLVVLVKVLSKLIRVQKARRIENLQLDDIFILAAMIAALGEALAVSREVPAGVGRHRPTLSNHQLNDFQQATYASQFLYIGALSMAKFAAFSFLLDLTRDPSYRLAVFEAMFVTGIWTVVAWIGIAAQCSLSAKWDILSHKCFDQRLFWDGIEVINMLIDLALIVLPTITVLKLQTSWERKSTVLVAFAIRIVIFPPTVVRLVYISWAFNNNDQVFAEWRVAVVTQVAMNTSIIVACVPFLKPVMEHLQPGWSTSNVRVGIGFNTIAASEAVSRSGFATGSVVKSGLVHGARQQISDGDLGMSNL